MAIDESELDFTLGVRQGGREGGRKGGEGGREGGRKGGKFIYLQSRLLRRAFLVARAQLQR